MDIFHHKPQISKDVYLLLNGCLHLKGCLFVVKWICLHLKGCLFIVKWICLHLKGSMDMSKDVYC